MKKLLFMTSLVVLGAWLSGCGDLQCDRDADCADGEVCADAGGVLFSSRICVAASDLPPTQPGDMASDLGEDGMVTAEDMSLPDVAEMGVMPSDMSTDAGQPDAPCVPRTTQEICTANGADCGEIEVEECGATLMLNCGGCQADNESCNAQNKCECVPETDEDFCAAAGADCDVVNGRDNCGMDRSVDCGMCDGNEVCGEQAPNVCGCPCNIGGTCYPDGAVNPSNPCEVCDPPESTTSWSLDVGRTCSDEDPCTTDDICRTDGSCRGDEVQCTASSVCRTASCNPSNGACEERDVPDGSVCPGAGPSCVSYSCQSGSCQSAIDSGSCLISGSCYSTGDSQPGDLCQQCRPGISQTSWSLANSGTPCESDGIPCTQDVCNDSGSCVHQLVGNRCLISGTCYMDEDRNPNDECEWCDPSESTSSWSIAANQQCTSDGLSCTTDVCNATGQCVHLLQANKCRINSTCYNEGNRNPNNECEWCDPGTSPSAWVNATAGTSCTDDGVSCTDDICDGNGTCDHPITANKCLVGTTCYDSGESPGFNCCQACVPLVSQTSLSDANEGMTCATYCGFGPGTCQGGVCTDGIEVCIPDACP